jgi:uncharacterized protein YbjQ (UPF0145 family)
MDEQSIASLINYGGFALVIVVTYFIGSAIERRHFRRIIKKEAELRDILAFAIRRAPTDLDLSRPKLVFGNAVISVDYFKTFAAGLRDIIGGRIGSYESLFERARREAMLRMKEEARRHGGNIVLNVKFETTRIYSGGGHGAISVEALAYGMAYSRSGEGAEIH